MFPAEFGLHRSTFTIVTRNVRFLNRDGEKSKMVKIVVLHIVIMALTVFLNPASVYGEEVRVGEADVESKIRSLLSQRAYLDALETMESALESTDGEEMKCLRGLVYFKAGMPGRAAEPAEKVLEGRPDNPECHLVLGEYYYTVNRPMRALHHLHKAVEDKRTADSAFKLIIRIQSEQGDPVSSRKAVERYTSFLKAAGREVPAHLSTNLYGTEKTGYEMTCRFSGDFHEIELQIIESSIPHEPPSVPVNCGNGGTHPFEIDTTYPGFMALTPELAAELGVKPLQTAPDDAQGAINYGILQEVRLGALTISRIPVAIIHDPVFAGKRHGLLGTGFLKRFNVILDITGRKLLLYPHDQAGAFRTMVEKAEAAVRVKFYIADALRIPVVADAAPPAVFALSTAAPSNLLDKAHAERFMNGGKHVNTEEIRIDDESPPLVLLSSLPLKIGEHRMPAVNAIITDLDPLNTASRIYTGGVIGSALLAKYRLYFDFDHCILSMVPVEKE